MLVVGGIGWSVFASISGAVIVSGWVASESRNQVVEHIAGGTVSAVLVRDGDTVAAGEVLLRFDDVLPRSEEAILRAQYAELVAQRNRLEAEFRSADGVVWDVELAALGTADSEVAEILSGQERLFRARIDARTGEVAQLRERIGQARQEIAGLQARAASVEQQGELIGEELTAKRRLFDQGAVDRSAVLALERAAENLRGLAGANAAAIARTRGRIAEHEIQILQIDATRIEEAEERARAVQAKENEVREQLASVRDRLGRLEVRAPVAGEVFGMTVFAAREVVRPGEPILHIVPAGRRGAGGGGAARADPRGPGVSGAAGHAAVQRVFGAHDPRVRGPRGAGVGGRAARCGPRPVLVSGRGVSGRSRGCGWGARCRAGRADADAGHAGRDPHSDRRTVADQLSRQAADRLFSPLPARRMNDAVLEVSLANELREIAGVAARIDEFCAAQKLIPSVAYAVNLAIDEILTNTISYGYDDDERHLIEIIVSLEADSIAVVIVDDSMPFDLGLAPERDLDLSLEDTALGGLGLFLVHQMMDSVDYRREEGCNVVTLIKDVRLGDPDDDQNGTPDG